MAAGLSSLDDEDIGAGLLRRRCLIRGRDGDPHLGASEMQQLDELRRWRSERERHSLHRIGLDKRDLGVPVIVVVPRLPSRHTGLLSPGVKSRDAMVRAMERRDELRASSRRFLEEGETLQLVFPCQTGPRPIAPLTESLAAMGPLALPLLILLFPFALRVGNAVFVVTDRRIVVVRAGRLRTRALKSVLTTVPRETRFGVLSGEGGKLELDGSHYWVNQRFFRELEAADNLLAR